MTNTNDTYLYNYLLMTSLELEEKTTLQILTIITRDGKVQVSHALAKQISPMLERFMDSWDTSKTNEIYLNYSTTEVNEILDKFNAPGTLKEFLMYGKQKELKFADIIDDIDGALKNLQVKFVASVNVRGLDGRLLQSIIKVIHICSVLATCNNRSVIYLFGKEKKGKGILLYQFDKLQSNDWRYVGYDEDTVPYVKGVKEKNINVICEYIKALCKVKTYMLTEFYPLN
jgi:hypothetical protein